MSKRRPRAPDHLPMWVASHRPTTIYMARARPGDPKYECVGGPLCGSIVVMNQPYSCLVPGYDPGPGVYPGIYVACQECGLMYFHLRTTPRAILPCGHCAGGYEGQTHS